MIRVRAAVSGLLLLGACAREPAEVIREVPLSGNGQGGMPNDGSNGLAGGDSAEMGGTSAIAGSAPMGPQLTVTSHPGYRQPLCLDCHGAVAAYPHVDEAYRPQDCIACHGDNGAPQRDHAVVANPGCPGCHGTVSHVLRFAAPTDCVKCHGAG